MSSRDRVVGRFRVGQGGGGVAVAVTVVVVHVAVSWVGDVVVVVATVCLSCGWQ